MLSEPLRLATLAAERAGGDEAASRSRVYWRRASRAARRFHLTAAVLTLGLLTLGCRSAPPIADQAAGEASQTVGAPSAGVVGDLRLVPFASRIFGNTRTLRVLLPPGYDSSENRSLRYPVLYLNDGQNLFDSSTAVLNSMEWRVDETVQAMMTAGQLPPLIVVGIDNAGRRDRFKEYFPWFDEYLTPPEPNPQGKRFPSFLIDEVLPFIEARYRVTRDPRRRVVGGSSAGALAALYAVVARPGVFGGLLVESPSLYVDNYHILTDAAAVPTWPRRVYLGVGTNESNSGQCDPNASAEPQLLQDVRRLIQTLERSGVDSSRTRLVVTPCGMHNEAAWAARLPTALSFLFPRPEEGGKR